MANLDLLQKAVRSQICSERPAQYDCGRVRYSREWNPVLFRFETVSETEVWLNNKFIKTIKVEK